MPFDVSPPPPPTAGPSPFAALLEQAIRQEIARPQGRYTTDISSNYRPYATTYYSDGPFGVERIAAHPEQDQGAALSAAAAQADAAANATQGQKLHSLLGGYGQYAGAQADMMRAKAARDEVALRSDPNYQKFIMDVEGLKQGIRPGSIAAEEADREALARRGVGVQTGTTLPPALEAVESLERRGFGPGSPEAGAVAATYPAEVRSGLAGDPVGVLETGRDMLYGGVGSLFGAMGFPRVKAGTDMALGRMREGRAGPYRRMFGAPPASGVGVAAPPAGAGAKPGVNTFSSISKGEIPR